MKLSKRATLGPMCRHAGSRRENTTGEIAAISTGLAPGPTVRCSMIEALL
jgi:hypothetical protein